MKTARIRFFGDISFLVALFLKVFSKGFTYFPVLDDHIQYGGYPLYENLSHVYLNIGTIVTRPFAAILDPAVWGQFYPNLWIVLMIISILFFFGVKLIAETLERTGIFITPFLYAVVLLIPLGFEGTYWISASSRICVGLFFAGLAAFTLVNQITKRKKLLFVPYAICTLLSFGFYESVMVFSAFLQFVVILGFVKNNKKRITYLITPAVLGISMLVYYKLIAGISTLGSRVNTFEPSMLGENIRELFTQFYDIIVGGGIITTTIGAIDGIGVILRGSYLLLVLIVVIAAACAYFGSKAPFVAKAKYCIPIGLALTFLPLVPNLLTETVWLTYRSIVPCLLGLAITSAGILGYFLKNSKVRMILIFVMVFVFMLGNINELDTYMRVSEKDNALVTEIAQLLDAEVIAGNKEAIVAYTEDDIITPQTSFYKDHVKSVFDSDWALTGAVRAKIQNIKIKMITPMDAGLLALADIDTSSVQIIYLGGNNG